MMEGGKQQRKFKFESLREQLRHFATWSMKKPPKESEKTRKRKIIKNFHDSEEDQNDFSYSHKNATLYMNPPPPKHFVGSNNPPAVLCRRWHSFARGTTLLKEKEGGGKQIKIFLISNTGDDRSSSPSQTPLETLDTRRLTSYLGPLPCPQLSQPAESTGEGGPANNPPLPQPRQGKMVFRKKTGFLSFKKHFFLLVTRSQTNWRLATKWVKKTRGWVRYRGMCLLLT